MTSDFEKILMIKGSSSNGEVINPIGDEPVRCTLIGRLGGLLGDLGRQETQNILPDLAT